MYPSLLLASLYVIVFLYGNSRHFSTLLQEKISAEIPGQITVSEIRLESLMTGVELRGARVFHPDGTELAFVGRAHARVSLLPTVAGQLTLTELEVHDLWLLIQVDDKGDLSFEQAFDNSVRRDPRLSRTSSGGGGSGPIFDGITVDGAELLVQTPEISILLHQIHVQNGFVDISGEDPEIQADVELDGGRIILMAEALSMADDDRDNLVRRYDLQRRHSPWEAAAVPPEIGGGTRGPAILELGRVRVEDFRQIGPSFTADVDVRGEGLAIVGEGGMNPDGDRSGPTYDFRGDISLATDAPALQYFLDGAILPSYPTSEAMIHVDIAGSMRQIGGSMTLQWNDIKLADREVDEVSLSVRTEEGGAFEFYEPGLQVTAQGGHLDARGSFDPSDGTFEISTWIDAIPSQWLIGDGLDPQIAAGTVSTEPAEPVNPSEPGIYLTGDLDSRTFGDFEAARLERFRRGETMVRAEIAGLRWGRDSLEGLPFQSVTLVGAAELTYDGLVRLLRQNEAPVTATLDRDVVMAQGELDLLTERFNRIQLSGTARSLGRLLDTTDFNARASIAAVVNGRFSDPTARVTSLELQQVVAGDIRADRVRSTLDVTERRGRAVPDIDDASVSVTNLSVAGVQLDRVDGRLDMVNGELRVESAEARGPLGEASVSGTVGLFQGDSPSSDPRIALRAAGRQINLARLFPDLPIGGTLAVTAEIAGTVSRPEITGNARVEEALVFGEWLNSATANFYYGANGVRIDDLVAVADAGVVSGAAQFNPDMSLRSGRIQTRELQLSQIQNLVDLGLDLSGTLQLNLVMRGPGEYQVIEGVEAAFPSPGLPDIEGNVIVRDLEVFGRPQGSSVFTVDTYGDFLHANGQLSSDLPTRLRIPLVDNQPLIVETHFDGVALSDLLPELADVVDYGELNQGRLVARIYPDGHIVAELLIGEVRIIQGGQRFVSESPLYARFTTESQEDGSTLQRLSISPFEFGTAGRTLTLSGELLDFRDLDFHLSGEADLSLLTLFSDSIAEAEGVVGVNLSVTGTLDDPAPEGELTFAQAILSPRGLGDEVVIRDGTVRISHLGEQYISVEIPRDQQLIGQVFDGSFSLSGSLDLIEFAPESMDIILDGTNVTYTVPDEASVTVSRTDITLFSYGLSGDEPEFFLSGNLLLEQGLYYKDIGTALGGVVAGTLIGAFDRQVERYEDPIWRQIPILENLQIEMAIRAPDGVRVENEILDAAVDIELQVDTTLTGTLREPLLEGEVKVLEGDITYQNRRFDVKSCTIAFFERSGGGQGTRLEGCELEATIERPRRTQTARASTDSQERITETVSERPEPYIIQVRVEGDLEEGPDFSLTSVNYSLREADIYSLILTGQTLDEFGSSASGSPSLEILFRQLSGLIETQVQESLNIDEFSVSSSFQEGTTVRAEEQVSERLNLIFETTVFGNQGNSQAVTGQLTLTEWLLFELYVRTGQDTSEATGRLRLHFDLD
ncbi:MAG: translocation/assembly module TamB domain-containing protein [Myxococcales bacterium]|nr:translocation/assembly module TamB domain-containing protein [Myxococcales bacterium]